MIRETYWEDLSITTEDIEALYNHLLETETPLTPEELAAALVAFRLEEEQRKLERQRGGGASIYLPKGRYEVGQPLVFPALDWAEGEVVAVREAHNPTMPPFEVIRVRFADGREREFAAGLEEHILNEPPQMRDDDPLHNPESVLATYGSALAEKIEAALTENDEFVRIAGKWFPRALLMDVHVGYLNLAEAVLDMHSGGPLPTAEIIKQIDFPVDNPKLAEFSLDYALQESEQFDEVGPAGQVLWFLRSMEPQWVQETPPYLHYRPLDYDRDALTPEMLALEAALGDELSPEIPPADTEQVELTLIYPHWRAGTLPLSAKTRALFPTAYQAPRVRFTWVDAQTGEEFPGWVVRPGKYVYGLEAWYKKKELMPGSLVTLKPGKTPGQVLIQAHTHRPQRDWVRSVLVGRDAQPVFAMLKQIVSAEFDERMVIAVPDPEALDAVWEEIARKRTPLENLVVSMLRELAKLTPQGHVHAAGLYAAVNTVRRCPPGPIFALLATRPWFVHVGDLYFRLDESAI